MLDYRTAGVVANAVNEHARKQLVTIDEAKWMEEVEICRNCGYKVFALQKGNMTILVHPYLGEDNSVKYKIKFLEW